MLLDGRTGRAIARFGRDGEGPGELTMPYNFKLTAGADPKLWVLQPNIHLLTGYDLSRDPKFVGSIRFSGKTAATDALLLRSGLLTTGPIRDSAIVTAGDSNLARPRRWGHAPYLPADLPPVLVFDANDLVMAANRTQDRVAVAFKYASELEVLDTNGVVIKEWKIPGSAVPRVRQRNAKPVTFDRDLSRVAVTSIAASDSEVVVANCLCDGKKAWEEAGTRRIEFYRWDGTPMGHIPFAKPVGAVAISGDGHTVYVATNQPEPQIVVFTVKY
jgi:hypothetical protein